MVTSRVRGGAGTGIFPRHPEQSTSENHTTHVSSKPGLFQSVSVRSKHKRSESDDSGRSLGGQSQIEPDIGYIPGRSFVGRILECGWGVKDEVAKESRWSGYWTLRR